MCNHSLHKTILNYKIWQSTVNTGSRMLATNKQLTTGPFKKIMRKCISASEQYLLFHFLRRQSCQLLSLRIANRLCKTSFTWTNISQGAYVVWTRTRGDFNNCVNNSLTPFSVPLAREKWPEKYNGWTGKQQQLPVAAMNLKNCCSYSWWGQ